MKKVEKNIGRFCWMNFFDGLQLSLPVFIIFLLGTGMNLKR